MLDFTSIYKEKERGYRFGPYLIPYKYLSHSQIELWNKSRNGWADRYVEKNPVFETAWLVFGRWFADLLEECARRNEWYDDDPIVNKVIHLMPRFGKETFKIQSEYKIEVNVPIQLDPWNPEGGFINIPFKGYLDQACFSSNGLKVKEIKTGGANFPWTQERVNEAPQLWLYCLCCYLKGYGIPEIELVWCETDYKVDPNTGKENVFFTGRVETFTFKKPTEKALKEHISYLSEVVSEQTKYLNGYFGYDPFSAKIESLGLEYFQLLEDQKRTKERIEEVEEKLFVQMQKEDRLLVDLGFMKIEVKTRRKFGYRRSADSILSRIQYYKGEIAKLQKRLAGHKKTRPIGETRSIKAA